MHVVVLYSWKIFYKENLELAFLELALERWPLRQVPLYSRILDPSLYTWPDLQESHVLVHFSNSRLLHFLYLDSQRNGPPKFQLWKSRAFKATALQSGDSRKIDLYSDYTGKNLEALK